MPSESTWILFIVTSVGFGLLPGPSVVFLIARAVTFGPWSAWRSALGVETATTTFGLLTAAGLSQVIAASTTLFGLLKWGGVCYLCWLGIRALTRRDIGAPGSVIDRHQAYSRRPRGRREYAEGFLSGISNPKIAVFFVAFLPQFVRPEEPAGPQLMALGLVFAACGLGCDAVWCLASGLLAGRVRGNRGLQARVRRTSGIVYLGLAGWAAVSGSHHKA